MQERYRKELERLEFPLAANKPLIMSVEEAYGIDTDYYRLSYVSWWGDEERAVPSGFTPCRIDQQSPDGDFAITVFEERGYQGIVEYRYVVPADTLLLAFYGTVPDEEDHDFLDE